MAARALSQMSWRVCWTYKVKGRVSPQSLGPARKLLGKFWEQTLCIKEKLCHFLALAHSPNNNNMSAAAASIPTLPNFRQVIDLITRSPHRFVEIDRSIKIISDDEIAIDCLCRSRCYVCQNKTPSPIRDEFGRLTRMQYKTTEISDIGPLGAEIALCFECVLTYMKCVTYQKPPSNRTPLENRQKRLQKTLKNIKKPQNQQKSTIRHFYLFNLSLGLKVRNGILAKYQKTPIQPSKALQIDLHEEVGDIRVANRPQIGPFEALLTPSEVPLPDLFETGF